MFYCKTCKQKFAKPNTVFESHGMSSPPFEKLYLCPYCGSERIQTAATHCRCCGAKLFEQTGEYCCEKCRTRGKEMWRHEKKKRKKLAAEPLFQIVREVDEYNRNHTKKVSYGTYVFLKEHSRHV